MTFNIHHVTCKCEKKRFHCSFENYSFFALPEKPPHASVKTFFAIYGRFCEIGAFPLGVFSIRDFNLHNLKGNGNASNDSCQCENLVPQCFCTILDTEGPPFKWELNIPWRDI